MCSISTRNKMAIAYERDPRFPFGVPRPEPVRVPPPPPQPKGYTPKSVAVSLLSGRTVLKSVCLSFVVSPPAPSPPVPKPPAPPEPELKPGRIVGTVQDAKTKRVLWDVVIRLNGEQTITSQSGYYQFWEIEPGSYILSAEKEGYKEFRWSIRIREDDRITKDISLEPIPVAVFKLPPGKWWRMRYGDWARDLWIPRGEDFFVGAFDTLEWVINTFIKSWVRRYGGTVEDYLSAPYSAIGISPYVGRIISGFTKIQK